MNIGLVFDDSLDKTDGVAQYVLTLGGWLAEQGHTVHYLVGQTKRTDLKNLHSLSRNITVRFNQNQLRTPLPASKSAIKNLLAKENFDVLHVMMPYSPWMAARVVAAAGPKTAVVGTFHIIPASKLVYAGTKILGRYLHQNLLKFDEFISVSDVARDFAKNTFGIDSNVIPNTAPLKNFFGASPLAKYKKHLNVVFLGRLVGRKGCTYLLNAAAKLFRDGAWPKDARVIICGDGPLRISLLQFISENNLNEIVELAGFVSEQEKPRFLASADVAVFPSTGGESFGIVLIEAMAAARGVVLAGNNPGYSSVMRPRPQSLFPPKNTDEFAKVLLENLLDDKLRKDAHSWQQGYAAQFAPDEVGKQIVAAYERALRNRRK